MEINRRNYVLKANGLFQDGKVHFAGRFPVSHSDFPNNWIEPVYISRDQKCPVNTVELNEVPMNLREKFINNLVEKRHKHPLFIEDSGRDSKKKVLQGNYQSGGGVYVIFEHGGQDELKRDYFNVIPIKEWYHFKGVPTSTFTAEEAEKFISSQAVSSIENAFNFHKQKINNSEEDRKYQKLNIGLDDGEFKPLGKTKQTEEDEDHEHLDFDFNDDADVGKHEKMKTFYTEDLTFDSGPLSEESKKLWKLVRKEEGEDPNEIDDDEDEEFKQFFGKSDSKDPAVKTEPDQKGKKGRKKRSGDDSINLIQPKKKIVKDNTNLPEGALTELEIETEVRKFFLIRPSIEPKQLLTHFKHVIKATPEGDKIFLKVIQRICKRKDKAEGTKELILKDDTRTYH